MNKEPVAREEIEKLNATILRVGFKIPELHDPEFLNELPTQTKSEEADTYIPNTKAITNLQKKLTEFEQLKPVNRGFAFEKFLSELFELFNLAPRGAFRLTGEQIDGSFKLDGEVYLLEARWRKERAANNDLLAFAGKVSGKAQWSRGLFVSYAGFSEDGLEAFQRGRSTNIIGLDGLDLHHIFVGSLDLGEVLRLKVRRAGETNRVFVPLRELFLNVT